jgi:hypothetical protein
MIPAMIGPLKAEASVLPTLLCSGGTVSLPAPVPDAPPGPGQGPCCAKGCHSHGKRKRVDQSQ